MFWPQLNHLGQHILGTAVKHLLCLSSGVTVLGTEAAVTLGVEGRSQGPDKAGPAG